MTNEFKTNNNSNINNQELHVLLTQMIEQNKQLVEKFDELSNIDIINGDNLPATVNLPTLVKKVYNDVRETKVQIKETKNSLEKKITDNVITKDKMLKMVTDNISDIQKIFENEREKQNDIQREKLSQKTSIANNLLDIASKTWQFVVFILIILVQIFMK